MIVLKLGVGRFGALNKKEIDEILLKVVAPMIAIDGGEVELVEVDDSADRIQLRFGGTYFGHPCRGIVFKYIVEPILKDRLATLKSIEMVD